MKDSLSRMKNKVGAQMGAFIKMKQEKMYIYQFVYVVRYVPIIAPLKSNSYVRSYHSPTKKLFSCNSWCK